MLGLRVAWCLAMVPVLLACGHDRVKIEDLADTIEIQSGPDAESKNLAKKLEDSLMGELKATHATEQVVLQEPSQLDELSHRLKQSQSEVVVVVGLQPKFRGEVSNAINVAVRRLDEQGTKVFTVLADLPETRRRAYFGFEPGSKDRDIDALADLAARQIVGSHVHKRQIATFQILRPSDREG
ncbi:MAG: hypothetical protein HONBIEJF_02695 [Fimbriimonadaceae bacterium]|nr:hypothetical protein [Fimbriimonadaceae bacterium]